MPSESGHHWSSVLQCYAELCNRLDWNEASESCCVVYKQKEKLSMFFYGHHFSQDGWSTQPEPKNTNGQLRFAPERQQACGAQIDMHPAATLSHVAVPAPLPVQLAKHIPAHSTHAAVL